MQPETITYEFLSQLHEALGQSITREPVVDDEYGEQFFVSFAVPRKEIAFDSIEALTQNYLHPSALSLANAIKEAVGDGSVSFVSLPVDDHVKILGTRIFVGTFENLIIRSSLFYDSVREELRVLLETEVKCLA